MTIPSECIAFSSPSFALEGLSKSGRRLSLRAYAEMTRRKEPENLHSSHEGTAWRLFIIDPSNPSVHSVPMHVGIRMKYKNRRFGFWYHFILSAWTISMRRGSLGSLILRCPRYAKSRMSRSRWDMVNNETAVIDSRD
jgi:hypothetical protein